MRLLAAGLGANERIVAAVLANRACTLAAFGRLVR